MIMGDGYVHFLLHVSFDLFSRSFMRLNFLFMVIARALGHLALSAFCGLAAASTGPYGFDINQK